MQLQNYLSSFLNQLSTCLHVGLTMFTGYLVGYAAFRALFGHSPAMSAAGGILGLVGAMLLETLLFIIRTSDQAPKSNKTKLKNNSSHAFQMKRRREESWKHRDHHKFLELLILRTVGSQAAAGELHQKHHPSRSSIAPDSTQHSNGSSFIRRRIHQGRRQVMVPDDEISGPRLLHAVLLHRPHLEGSCCLVVGRTGDHRGQATGELRQVGDSVAVPAQALEACGRESNFTKHFFPQIERNNLYCAAAAALS